MQHAEKNTFFRNIHLFINRARNFAMIKDYDAMKNNLYTCLRNMTMTWFTIEFFEEIKKLIKTKNNLNVWKRYLIKRFRKRLTVTMITIIREKYILENARRCRESREYADVIIRATKSTKLKFEIHLMMLIYNNLNVKLQKNIFMLDLIISIQNFLQSFDDKKKIWWTLTRRDKFIYEEKKSYVNYISKSNATYQNQFSIYYQLKFDQYDSQYSEQRNFEFSQRDQLYYQYDVNQSYQSQSQNFSNAKQLKVSKSQLQIIDSSQQNEFASFSKSYSSRFDSRYNQKNNREEYDRRDSLKRAWNQKISWNNRNRDNYNRSKTQKAYVDVNEKNQSYMKNSQFEQNHQQNENSDFILKEINKKNEDFYQIDQQTNEKYNYFLNENDYHIEIEICNQDKSYQCRNCKKKFSFNNKLHQHVRECRKIQKERTFDVETFHIEFTSDRIIISAAESNIFKDLTFRSWHFVIFFVRIFKNESLDELCANTNCIMFLMNRAYLKQILSDVKIHHIKDVITVRDIKTITHNCFEYVNLKLFIFETLRVVTFKRIAKLTRHAHIVNNLRAKFLMKMNILRSKKIVLDIFRRKMILLLCENLKINIRIISHTLDVKALDKRMNRVIQSKQLIFISFRTMTIVLIKTRKAQILSDRDYIFQFVKQELNFERTDEMMTHIINVNLAAVRIINFTNK